MPPARTFVSICQTQEAVRISRDRCPDADKSQPSPDLLTLGEREVLRLVTEGKDDQGDRKASRAQLQSAEFQRLRIVRKLETHNIAGVVRDAIKRG
jgi:DNA-binding NarL/FixJ family response regulator